MTDGVGAALWALRMLLLWLGGILAARGVGDQDLWGDLANTLPGAMVAGGAAWWSWRARRRQINTPPPPSDEGQR